MRVLFVGMPFSIHTVRWIRQLEGSGIEVHFFSSMPYAGFHADFPESVVIHENFFSYRGPERDLRSIQFPIFSFLRKSHFGVKWMGKAIRFLKWEMSRVDQLKKLIRNIDPDVVHSLESQHAGYLVTDAYDGLGRFPRWIHSNWGIDMHYFRNFLQHEARLRAMLALVDILVVEGKRDEMIAGELGFRGEVKTFPSVGGGFSVDQSGLQETSGRRHILVKGTQDEVRRGMVALQALKACKDLLEGYTILLYSSNELTRQEAAGIVEGSGIGLEVLGKLSQEEMIDLNRRSRISITVNLSDGVPNSMLEAMSVGCFPIQSDTSMGSEWIENGITGFLVSPLSVEEVASAVRRALQDDRLVDTAATKNINKIRKDLQYEQQRQKAIEMYFGASQKTAR